MKWWRMKVRIQCFWSLTAILGFDEDVVEGVYQMPSQEGIQEVEEGNSEVEEGNSEVKESDPEADESALEVEESDPEAEESNSEIEERDSEVEEYDSESKEHEVKDDFRVFQWRHVRLFASEISFQPDPHLFYYARLVTVFGAMMGFGTRMNRMPMMQTT